MARKTTDYEKMVFKIALGLDVNEVYEAVGCKNCINGFMGRIAIHEVLMLNQDVRDAIVANKSKEYLREMVYKKGHTVTLLQDGLEKVLSGDTTFEEIVQVIDIESDLGEDEQELKDALLGKTPRKEDSLEVSNNTVDTLDIKPGDNNVSNTEVLDAKVTNDNTNTQGKPTSMPQANNVSSNSVEVL